VHCCCTSERLYPGSVLKGSQDETADNGVRAVPPARTVKRRLVGLNLLVFAPLAAFVPLAVEAHQKGVFQWDRRFSEYVHGYENKDTPLNAHVDVFGLLLHPAVQLIGFLAVVAIVVVTAVRARARLAIFAAVGVGGAVVLAPLLKEIVQRPPVDVGDAGYSFPSGHAMRSMAAAAVLVVGTWRTPWRWQTTLVAAIVVVLVGIAVVYHEWHWASDVLGGWCVAIAWVGLSYLAFRPLPDATDGTRTSPAVTATVAETSPQ
jgi:membrane-associated phospholipid phosphatase